MRYDARHVAEVYAMGGGIQADGTVLPLDMTADIANFYMMQRSPLTPPMVIQQIHGLKLRLLYDWQLGMSQHCAYYMEVLGRQRGGGSI